MAEECTHNCSTCGMSCGSRTNKIEKKDPAKGCKIKKIIGVSSGKGGVGKSLVTSLIASQLTKKGKKVGILDADILGPSIPKSFGVCGDGLRATEDNLMIPIETVSGIKIISSNLLLEDETEPIIYRGSLIAGVLEQFFEEVMWGDLDVLLIDMPPGTGDVALTCYQSLPIDKVILVTSPQSLVNMIVEKSINMAMKMDVSILGIIENMSYVECPNCKDKIFIYGESNIDDIALNLGVDVLGKLPIREEIARNVDSGLVEEIKIPELNYTIEKIENLLKEA